MLRAKKVKIATWNVNSINARIEIVVDWINNNQPDILLLQELKCQNDNFPYQQFEDLGYNIAIYGQKSYNGVAILSRFPLEDIVMDFKNNPDPSQARYIEAVISYANNKVIKVASVYVPNGKEVDHENFQYKLKFLEAIHDYYQDQLKYNEAFFIGGDFNVALENLDVFDADSLEGSICFHKDERKIFRKLFNAGYYDLFRQYNQDKGAFSWWDYRAGAWQKNQGMRIDYMIGSPEACSITTNCYIDETTRSLDKTSDHAPVIVSITS
ncbi:Exodeoxyribonuclease III [Candidatus Arcanobacter lacustris]|uniref:Exodeoxyribonuclease III n=1 Tax=Candidatus Arcanibacter lacustris TaxID=1607817 RepID=A0A0F5MPA0_9RICK|nr:Exodeoxyribonuclease III [Candidatus Arcanobacter lacustris]